MSRVCVVGLGYVGLTLATLLARKGFEVWGCDRNAAKVDAIAKFRPPFFEPGVTEALRETVGANLHLSARFEAKAYDAIIIAVSTPVDAETRHPDLTHVEDAVREVSAQIVGDPLVIVRSTVPVGTTDTLLLPILRQRHPELAVAMAPERTIQGQALRELQELPQIVGGVDEKSRDRATAFFESLGCRVVTVSSSRAAELVKLINNAHTDVIYAFGNEVALLAHQVGVDPREAIAAANAGYPRPKLHVPGYVGGGCLTKDPYLLSASVNGGSSPEIILSARRLNESMPSYTAQRVLSALRDAGVTLDGAPAVVCGIAYKGTPATDDTRGAQSVEVIGVLKAAGLRVYGHDPLVAKSVIRSMDVEPIDTATSVEGVRAFVFLTDHREYKLLEPLAILAQLERPAVVFDAWRIFHQSQFQRDGVAYQSIGV
jgi:UDP-N-acetyl-D-mannosaminuronic acid dehydrogenase